MSCGVGHRCSSDPELLWLQCRLVAIAPIRPLAWEPPYAAGSSPRKGKKTKKKRKEKKRKRLQSNASKDDARFRKKNKIEAKTDELEETFIKGIQDLKIQQAEMINTIAEIKNSLEGNNSII